jgi:hypothetical protein
MCHGESAAGFNGEINTFSSYLPGNGPNAATGYAVVERASVMIAPIVASQAAGPLGDALDAAVIADMGPLAIGAAATTSSIVLNEGEAILALVQNGRIIAQGDVGLSHVELVNRQLGGILPQGAEVVTIGKFDGQIVAYTSRSFYGVQAPASASAQAVARTAFR